MKRFLKTLRNPAVASAALTLAVFLVIAGTRELGVMQSAELFAYDKLLVWRAGPETTDERTLIVGITEADIRKYGFPLSDALLASLFETVISGDPAVVGLDLYRDLPEPRQGGELERLNRVLRQNQNVIGIFVFGDDPAHPFKIPFPPALASTPERYGFNEFPSDEATVRRGWMLLWDNQDHVFNSFALALAAKLGVSSEPVGSDLRLGKTVFRRFEQNDGGYVRAPDYGFQFLLDFKGPRKFESYSLDDVLTGRIKPEIWRGKTVLIGEVGESAHDFETTPLQFDVPGVEIHAQILNQLLRAAERGDKPTISWGEPVELGWTFGWCILGGLIGFFLRRPMITLAACIATASVLAGMCWAAFAGDLWLPLVPPLLGNVAAAAVVTGYTRQQERKDRNTLMRLFSQHVSPAIAESMWTHREEFIDGNRPRPQKLQTTVLFTDFRNFSTVSEKLQPSEVMEWINNYMESLAKHIQVHDGFINKYMGDAIMAVFGFPQAITPQADVRRDASNAVRAALDMKTEMSRLNQRWEKMGLPPVQMRVGIFSGPAVAGCIGSTDRLEFTVMGDTVNTAARLESFDKDYASDDICRILIGESTLDLVNGQFRTEFVQSIELKGKNRKTTIYRVLGGNE
jgi:adenylate cyclase